MLEYFDEVDFESDIFGSAGHLAGVESIHDVVDAHSKSRVSTYLTSPSCQCIMVTGDAICLTHPSHVLCRSHCSRVDPDPSQSDINLATKQDTR